MASASCCLAYKNLRWYVLVQFEALCALKRPQEASETLVKLTEQDKSFEKSKEFKGLLRQLQAIS